MNDELVKDKLDTHERRLNNHSERLDKLEQDGRELKTELKNLCENLKSLTSMMKWFIATLVGALISFFFYAVQTGIFNK
ncbi:hemolysin XhlA family protein [Clostridium saccharobutylicum]|uniref:Hemolysin XhlA n=1 Tax=Clostridium saccharobutylicum DSM 13864 TaxID=1345695 RepID=U5MRM7_CLOSA|nr:hemolysin XhlA family protein [Clostridium saccharobutylicum]AGX43265.1 hemolysin XhlA [Clostridium saccharobutylicum DSM 13864]AQR90565.1 hemolysin XhlA [Clostridium saccharobutylicum]AQS00469.1 hemolysin XhlA [Clostridium saccharobutylicum]AQS10119.1 hemolysin XhlA [Clostridium saccharobutylicum]AQS14452.1 hemolysin XhlA [Clostridium saccharobutylicum]